MIKHLYKNLSNSIYNIFILQAKLFSSYIYLTFKIVDMLETGDTSLQIHCPKVTALDIWRFVGSLFKCFLMHL